MPHLDWLEPEQTPKFPSTTSALSEPNGLLAVGGALTLPWLTTAYQHGIFPWFSDDDPIMWWSPSPRMVLQPGQAHIARTVKKQYRRAPVTISLNRCFEDVIHYCSNPALRADNGTWITADMTRAYTELHQAGWAHSIEVWRDKKLIGGLYGIGMDRMFFGESMFSCQSGASKFAFITLSELASKLNLSLIDCQLHNAYLESLGAALISRSEFEQHLPQQRKPLSLPANDDLTSLLNDKLKPVES